MNKFFAALLFVTLSIHASEFDIKKMAESLEAPVSQTVLPFLAKSIIVTNDGKRVLIAPHILMQSGFFKRYLESSLGQDFITQKGLAVGVKARLVRPFLTLMKKQYEFSRNVTNQQELIKQLFLYLTKNPRLGSDAFELLMLADEWDNHTIMHALASFIAHNMDTAVVQKFIQLPIHMQQAILTQSPLFVENFTDLLMFVEAILQQNNLDDTVKQTLLKRIPEYAQFLAKHSKKLLRETQLIKFLESKNEISDALRSLLIEQYYWYLITTIREFEHLYWYDAKLSSNQKYLIVYGSRMVQIFDINTGKLEKQIKLSPGMRSYYISPDMSYAVTTFRNGPMTITYLEDKTATIFDQVPANPRVGFIHITDNGNYIMVPGDATTTIWDRNGNVVGTINRATTAISYDGSRVIKTGLNHDTLQVVDTKTNNVIQQFATKRPGEHFYPHTDFTPDEKGIVSVEYTGLSQNQMWQIWDIATGNLIKELPFNYDYNLSNDMRYILARKENETDILDFATENVIRTLPGRVYGISQDYVIAWYKNNNITVLGIDPKMSIVDMMKILSKYNILP